jgi:hypothetical protein
MEGKYALLIVYLKKEYIMDFVGIKKKKKKKTFVVQVDLLCSEDLNIMEGIHFRDVWMCIGFFFFFFF